MAAVKLRTLAHSRTGDKGDTSNISVIAYRLEDFNLLQAQLTAERVHAFFAELLPAGAQVKRYALPRLGALNFILPGALKGGVTRSLAVDAHGKCLGAGLLDIAIETTAGLH